MMVTELAALKPQAQLEQMLQLVRQAADEGRRIDSVERDLMRQLLALGYTLLSGYVAQQGDGDMGPGSTPPKATPSGDSPSTMTAATCRSSGS